jgi:hypothetical protein
VKCTILYLGDLFGWCGYKIGMALMKSIAALRTFNPKETNVRFIDLIVFKREVKMGTSMSYYLMAFEIKLLQYKLLTKYL